jgi:hypothetical protein
VIIRPILYKTAASDKHDSFWTLSTIISFSKPVSKNESVSITKLQRRERVGHFEKNSPNPFRHSFKLLLSTNHAYVNLSMNPLFLIILRNVYGIKCYVDGMKVLIEIQTIYPYNTSYCITAKRTLFSVINNPFVCDIHSVMKVLIYIQTICLHNKSWMHYCQANNV